MNTIILTNLNTTLFLTLTMEGEEGDMSMSIGHKDDEFVFDEGELETQSDPRAPEPQDPRTDPTSTTSSSDTVTLTKEVCVLMTELGISAEEADAELRLHGGTVKGVLEARMREGLKLRGGKLSKHCSR